MLRLLLPLSGRARQSSRTDGTAESELRIASTTSPKASLDRSIGSSDGRCVQRAGTYSRRPDESPLQGIPRSRGTIAAPGPDGDRVSTITRSSRTGDRTDSINVARVQPGTSKGITDLLLLRFGRLPADDTSKKRTGTCTYRRRAGPHVPRTTGTDRTTRSRSDTT